jgi:hypothetical protein
VTSGGLIPMVTTTAAGDRGLGVQIVRTAQWFSRWRCEVAWRPARRRRLSRRWSAERWARPENRVPKEEEIGGGGGRSMPMRSQQLDEARLWVTCLSWWRVRPTLYISLKEGFADQ